MVDMKKEHPLYRIAKGDVSSLIYEDSPQYDIWLKLILGSTLAFTLVLGIVFLLVDLLGTWIMFGVTIFDALLFNAVIPRRYQIFQDKLKIVLGNPFAFSIPLSTIKEVRPASGSMAFAYWGIRLATSSSSVVEIVRSKGFNVVISPTNRDAFLDQLNQALKAVSNLK